MAQISLTLPDNSQWSVSALSGHGRGGGCVCRPWRKATRIPFSPVVDRNQLVLLAPSKTSLSSATEQIRAKVTVP